MGIYVITVAGCALSAFVWQIDATYWILLLIALPSSLPLLFATYAIVVIGPGDDGLAVSLAIAGVWTAVALVQALAVRQVCRGRQVEEAGAVSH